MPMSEIVINPLVILSPKPRLRTTWMCKHPEAVLVDKAAWIYRCVQCNPTTGTITVIPRVATTIKSPKRAAVSPSQTESP